MDQPVLEKSTCLCKLSLTNEEEHYWCKVGYANDSVREKLLSDFIFINTPSKLYQSRKTGLLRQLY